MASILSSKVRDDGKIIFEICATNEEALALGGHVENIHFFSSGSHEGKTQISGRGKNEATKYFLIPKNIRDELKSEAKYQMLNLGKKKIYIFETE